jgi:predicted alpha/beta superfamily hydrolase
VYSKNVKDSFEIKISYLGFFDSATNYSTAYYLDAKLKSGNKLRKHLSLHNQNGSLTKTLFIGIGFKGNNLALRRRDFIPPILNKGTTLQHTKPSYAHADKFYEFLTKELIPFIDKKYLTNGNRTLIGHSYGGLFTFYSLSKPEHLFKNYIALSPSLWVNRYNIFTYEEAYYRQTKQLNAYLYLSAGSRETINYILKGTKRIKRLLEERNYKGLKVDYFEHKGKTHHSQLPLSLAYVLRNTAF